MHSQYKKAASSVTCWCNYSLRASVAAQVAASARSCGSAAAGVGVWLGVVAAEDSEIGAISKCGYENAPLNDANFEKRFTERPQILSELINQSIHSKHETVHLALHDGKLIRGEDTFYF